MLADIATMNAMTPIGNDTLFSPIPSPSTLGTSAAPLGSAAWPTWAAGSPGTPGTVLGPLGMSVPSISPNTSAAAIPSVTGSGVPSNSGGINYSVASGGAGGGFPATTGAGVTAAVLSGNSNLPGTGQATMIPPAGTMDEANQTGLPLGPISFVHGWPSIVRPKADQVTSPAPPDLWCQFGNWVTANPILAGLGAIAVYFLLKGGRKQ